MKATSEASVSADGCTAVPITEIGMSMEAPCLCAVGAGNSKFYFGHVKIEISFRNSNKASQYRVG